MRASSILLVLAASNALAQSSTPTSPGSSVVPVPIATVPGVSLSIIPISFTTSVSPTPSSVKSVSSHKGSINRSLSTTKANGVESAGGPTAPGSAPTSNAGNVTVPSVATMTPYYTGNGASNAFAMGKYAVGVAALSVVFALFL